jgi:hypothetical protein
MFLRKLLNWSAFHTGGAIIAVLSSLSTDVSKIYYEYAALLVREGGCTPRNEQAAAACVWIVAEIMGSSGTSPSEQVDNRRSPSG